MSSAQVDRATKVGHINKKENDKSRKAFSSSHKKHKHEDNRHFKFGRKRIQSFTSNGKFFPPYKRRKKEGAIIPPTKFLLGGNICDPLNLNSMQDEEVNRAMNAVTPKSSPLPTPKHKKEAIEVIIPPNICDPLNLSNCNDNDEYEKQLISPTKKGSKRRNRKKKRASSGSGKDDSDPSEGKTKDNETTDVMEIEEQSPPEKIEEKQEHPPSESPPHNQPKESKPESPLKDKNKLRLKGLEEPKDKRLRKVDVKDKIVSPVIPQPGAWKPRPQHRPSQDKKKKQTMPNFREKNARYQYGNYNRYYGYRNLHSEVDTRLTVFAQRKELFFGKDVLDIGCNIGHITLSVARNFQALSVTGIDIDRTLINIARKNIKHYVNCVQSPASNEEAVEHRDSDANFFPMSMPINYGPVDIPGFTKNKNKKGFPYNVTFVQGNYVLEDDALLCSEQPQFDTILCLSITKWIHLNFGDAGLKQAFKRMHAQLRPGGVLVLEPQGWGSYGKKKNLTERIYKNYQNIEFRPHKFTQYLLSPEVGFCKCEVVSIPPHPSRGFQRPIHLFTKAEPLQGTPESTSAPIRHERRNQEIKDMERREYERELFRKDISKEGNMSEISQQSNESMSQYDQFENVYAPSATPCYDTPGHNNETQQADPSNMCYVNVSIEHDKMDQDSQELSEKKDEVSTKGTETRPSEESENKTSRKRNFNVVARDATESDDVKKIRINEDTQATKVSNTGQKKTSMNTKTEGVLVSQSTVMKNKEEKKSVCKEQYKRNNLANQRLKLDGSNKEEVSESQDAESQDAVTNDNTEEAVTNSSKSTPAKNKQETEVRDNLKGKHGSRSLSKKVEFGTRSSEITTPDNT